MTLVGLIGFSTYPNAYNLLDIKHSAAVVDSLRDLVDLLVVTFHGGTEGKTAVRTANGPEFLAREPRGDLRKWARAVIDAGADAVVGHGPHVLRGVEFYKGRPIFYSLGNFATYKGFNLAGPLGITAILQLGLSGEGKFESARLVPLVQLPGEGPAPDSASKRPRSSVESPSWTSPGRRPPQDRWNDSLHLTSPALRPKSRITAADRRDPWGSF
jgi:hypothetical protein